MATKKKMLQAAAGQTGGAGLDITEVFSTYLYDGTGSAQTITNGIDLSGEGGIVWLKNRTSAVDHRIVTPELSPTGSSDYYVIPNSTAGRAGASDMISSFNSDGFSLDYGYSQSNQSGQSYASWTFRKAPKFFTCLTYTGTGTAQNISHDLGSDVGFLLIKRTDSTSNWRCWHRGLPGTGSNMEFNQTGAYETATTIFNGTDPTSTQFSVGTNSNVNASGGTYVAYIFAHNDGDGEFGPDGDADIIKCGSYTSSNPTNRPEVDLGFEPQWLLIKNATASSNWMLVDNMRGLPVNGDDQTLAADSNAAENGIIGEPNAVALTPTGFKLTGGVTASNASTGNTHIYMAIRRGPLAQPESGTEVFAVHKETTSNLNQTPPFLQPAPFAVDFISNKLFGGSSSWWSATRLTNARLQFESTAAETSVSTTHEFDHNDGVAVNGLTGDTNFMGYMWKRAPGFFDVVAYTGTGSAQTINHNLGVVPEMVWVKSRNNTTSSWSVTSTELGAGYRMFLTSTSGSSADTSYDNGQTPTETVFYRGAEDSQAGTNYIAYLFATLPGVSKVGSYTGNGSSQTIDCGFTSGARFIITKRTDIGSNWHVFDSVRGIVTGNDPYLRLNSTLAENTTQDDVDPQSSGFIVNQGENNMNQSGGSYIFYAIA